MLRINLLPSYVTQRRLTKRLVPVFAILVLLSVALPLVAYVSMKKHLADLTQQAETAEQAKTANDALEALATSTRAQVQPILDKVNFVAAVHKHNRDQVAVINAVADQSPTGNAHFIYSGIAPGAGYQTMSIKAYSPSVEQVGRYLQAMYHAPVFSSVAVDKIPGYPDNVQHRWYLGRTMVFADGAASASGGGGGGYPGGGGGGGGGGYPGGGGRSGGSSAGGANSGPPGFSADNLGPNAPGNVPPGVGPPPPELTGDLPTGGGTGGGGYPGGAGAGGGQAGGYSVNFLRIALAGVSPFATPEVQARILKNKLRQVRRVTIPKGFDVTVTATVAPPYAPLTPPTPPGSAPAAAPGGGGFGGGSYPGGGGGSYPGGGGGSPYPGGRPTG